MFKFRTGLPWRDLPERFGPWQTVNGRFDRWAADGTFDRLLAVAQTHADVDRLVAIDSTIVRAHQHAALKGGSKNGASDAPAAQRRRGHALTGEARPARAFRTPERSSHTRSWQGGGPPPLQAAGLRE